jgi:hypothetical protein
MKKNRSTMETKEDIISEIKGKYRRMNILRIQSAKLLQTHDAHCP